VEGRREDRAEVRVERRDGAKRCGERRDGEVCDCVRPLDRLECDYRGQHGGESAHICAPWKLDLRTPPQQRHKHAEPRYLEDVTIDKGDMEKSPNVEQDHQGAVEKDLGCRAKRRQENEMSAKGQLRLAGFAEALERRA